MSMDSYMARVATFHQGCDHPVGTGSLGNRDLVELRLKLIEEEVRELRESLEESPRNDAAVLKELADIQYVLSGFAVAFGLPLPEAFDRVHASNLTKFVNGVMQKREDGKLLKGPHYTPPVLDDLLEKVNKEEKEGS